MCDMCPAILMGSTPLRAQKILFLRISTWERCFIIYTLSKSPIHLSFIVIYHFDTLSLAVWQDTCHTYTNLVYDLAHHESPTAQWLERPTGIWKVMGSTPVGGSENFFSEFFDLRTLLHYLKQLDYSLSISMRSIVDSASSTITS